MVGPRVEDEDRPMVGLPLQDRFVVLGVTGGIAAYKAVDVCRRLVDLGAHVAPVLTEEATRFVGPLTFSALASESCRTQIFDSDEVIPHTRLGQRAEVVVVAPATARFISAYATGFSDSLLTATVVATRAPVVVCPAMHTEMWEHPSVQENIATLRRRGVHIVWPTDGRLAGGDSGLGRLAEPEDIVAAVTGVLVGSAESPGTGRDLDGLRVLVTAGGTPRADRSGEVHIEPVVGQAGSCARRGRRTQGRDRDPGHCGSAPGNWCRRDREGRHGFRDGRSRACSNGWVRRRDHGRCGG